MLLAHSRTSSKSTESSPPILKESSAPSPRETFQPQSVLTYQNAREAMITEVDIAYARIMLLGPAGVGKTSLVRGLKKLPFIRKSTSTQVADVRPISYSWATGDWKDVNEQDELDEVANLLATVHHDLQSVEQLIISNISRVESVRVLYEGNSSVSSSEVEEGLVKEVETTKVESYLKEAIRRAKQLTPCSGVRDLKPSPFFHVWDCGGQPVFLEVLPAFLTPRTMFLLLFDASKNFNETWKSIQYEEGTGIPGEESNMTIIELLDRWMATIHSHLSERTKKGGLVDYPRILGIGTHGDLLNEEENRKVIEQFEKHCENKAFTELLDHEVFIVDNSSAQTDPGFSKLHEIIQRFATENLVVKTPVSWVLFRKVLQMFSNESRNVISFNEAKAIGIACKIEAEDIHKVLMFYHDLGVILFYPHIKSFEHRIILNPKWFVESLGKIITLPGREIQKTSKIMWKTLRKKGILIQPLYVAVWKGCKDIDPEGMMELLTHFRLAARVQAEVYYDLDTPQYFVPAVLPVFSGDLSTPTTAGSLRATPLHITFSTKFVTPGYFTRLVTTIASFEVCKLNFEEGIYRNRVVFEFTPDDKQYNFVTLTELSYAIQVDKMCESPDNEKSPFSKSCQDLLVLLKRSCEEVDECFYQGYPSNNTQSIKGYRDKFRFLCISDKCKTAENIHYLDKTRESQTCCQLRKQFRDLEEEESYWFPQVLQSAKSNTISEKEIVEISRQIGECGAELAALLGRKAQWVNIIQDPRKASNPIFYLLFDWNQQVGRRDELVKHLQTLNLLKLANQIEADHNESDMDSYRSETLLRKRHISSNPPQQSLDKSTARQPTPKRSQSAPHLIQVHHQKKHSSPMKQVTEEMESEDKFQDSTSVSKFIDLLLESEKFVQKLKTIQLAEKRAGDESNGGATSLDGFEHDDSWSARSRSTNSRPESSPVNSHSEILPPSLPVIQPPDVDNIPHTDIVRCCNFITCDINYLAAVMDLPEDEIAAITRSTSDVQAQILRIVKKWISKNPNKQKEDLNGLLMSAKLEDAARSLMDPNYNVEEPTQPSKRCNIL